MCDRSGAVLDGQRHVGGGRMDCELAWLVE